MLTENDDGANENASVQVCAHQIQSLRTERCAKTARERTTEGIRGTHDDQVVDGVRESECVQLLLPAVAREGHRNLPLQHVEADSSAQREAEAQEPLQLLHIEPESNSLLRRLCILNRLHWGCARD